MNRIRPPIFLSFSLILLAGNLSAQENSPFEIRTDFPGGNVKILKTEGAFERGRFDRHVELVRIGIEVDHGSVFKNERRFL